MQQEQAVFMLTLLKFIVLSETHRLPKKEQRTLHEYTMMNIIAVSLFNALLIDTHNANYYLYGVFLHMVIDFKQDILAPVATDFAAMDHLINEGISSKVGLVMSVSKHVVEAGGKRMRPIMCLLAARAWFREHGKCTASGSHYEMLHTATLVHDDVVDESGFAVAVLLPMQLGTTKLPC